jgi:hypothetical protein
MKNIFSEERKDESMEIKLTENQNAIAIELLSEKNRIEQMQKLNQEKMNIFLTTICGSNGVEDIGNIEYRDGVLVLPGQKKEENKVEV